MDAPDTSALIPVRLGNGYALVRFGAERPLRLAGVDCVGVPGTEGGEHDDGDAVCRAIVEGLLHACGLPGLATVFPDEHPDNYYSDSLILLSRTVTALLREALAGVVQCGVQVFAADSTMLAPAARAMTSQLAAALQVAPARVSISLNALPGQAAQAEPGELAALATVLCLLKQDAGVSQPRQARGPAGEAANAYAGQGARTETPVTVGAGAAAEHLPERARQFEQGVKSKLYPLPKAPRPESGARLIAYSDGASRGNPGPAASGYVILNEIGQLVHEGGSVLGAMTNNQAEYRAVLEVAQWIEKNLGREFKLEFRLDSQLVVRQLNGEYRIKDEGLKDLALRTMNALMYFWEFRIVHIPRAENSRADALANRALDAGKG